MQMGQNRNLLGSAQNLGGLRNARRHSVTLRFSELIMLNRKMSSLLVALLVVMPALVSYAPAEPPAELEALAAEPRNDSWWQARHREKLLAKSKQPHVDILLVGDSITHGWEEHVETIWSKHLPDLSILNLGFSGDRTEHVLWRLRDGAVEGLAARVTVVMIGTNNTGHRQDKPQDTAAGIEAIVAELKERLPGTHVLLLAVFPRGETTDDPLRKINVAINSEIADLANDERVTFLDLTDEFLTEDGVLSKDVMPDALHPNERGYQIWARSMAPHVHKLLAAGTSP